MLTAAQVKTSIRKFQDYADDLIQSDMNTFDDCLNIFMHFCESDPVFSLIHSQLQSVPDTDFDSWYVNSQRRGPRKVEFPVNEEVRMALMYELLRRINCKEISIHHFVHCVFSLGTTKITAYIQAFNSAITERLTRELGYRLDAMILPEDRQAEVSPTVIQIIGSAQNVIQQSASGTNITQTASNQISSRLDEQFNRLLCEIRKIESDPTQLKDHEEIIETAREESKKSSPKRGSIRTLLNALPHAGAIAEITALILDLIS